MRQTYEDFGKANNILDGYLFSLPGFHFDLVPAKSNMDRNMRALSVLLGGR